eukprot:4902260-Prymnesium_polylepis.1
MPICADFAALRPDLRVGQVWTRMGSAPLAVWHAPAGRAVRVHGGLGRHGTPPLRRDPIDSRALCCCSLGDSTRIFPQRTREDVPRGETYRERCLIGFDSTGICPQRTREDVPRGETYRERCSIGLD